jgi:hypothetical protein
MFPLTPSIPEAALERDDNFGLLIVAKVDC